jgi:hypothetical protein
MVGQKGETRADQRKKTTTGSNSSEARATIKPGIDAG